MLLEWRNPLVNMHILYVRIKYSWNWLSDFQFSITFENITAILYGPSRDQMLLKLTFTRAVQHKVWNSSSYHHQEMGEGELQVWPSCTFQFSSTRQLTRWTIWEDLVFHCKQLQYVRIMFWVSKRRHFQGNLLVTTDSTEVLLTFFVFVF